MVWQLLVLQWDLVLLDAIKQSELLTSEEACRAWPVRLVASTTER
jgi:hypothetical protein